MVEVQRVNPTTDRLTAYSGFICVSMPPERLQELQLPPLLPASGTSQDPKGTAYHLTIDANPCPASSSSAPTFRGFPSSSSQPPPLVAKGTSDAQASHPTHPVSTGISAHDRAYTARLLADGAGPEHFTRPGHMVPLRYTKGGVRNRRGHTECAVGKLSLPSQSCMSLTSAQIFATSLVFRRQVCCASWFTQPTH